MPKRIVLAFLACVWALPAVAQPAPAAEPRELIYCADLMSHAEREAYRQRMHAAPTREARDDLRAAHRAEMQQRARQAGREGQCETAGRQWRGGRGQ